MIADSIQSILMMLCLIGVGVYVAQKPWFGETGSALFSKFTVQIAIPCYMFYNVWSTCNTPQKLKELLVQLPIPFFIILLGLALGAGISRIVRIGAGRRGVFINAVSFSNTVIIGFPIIEALFGSAALPDAMVYYMANTVLFWTVGVFVLRHDSDPNAPFFSAKNIRSIFSPPLVGFLLGAVTVCLQTPLPGFLMDAVTMIKQLTTPMAMVFIGSMLYSKKVDRKLAGKELSIIVLSRFLITPILVLILCEIAGIPTAAARVFLILSTMPAMTQLGIMAHETKSDSAFASLVVTTTTIISMATIPIYVFIGERFLNW